MDNLTYWKWLRSIIKIPDKPSLYGFIFMFGALMAIFGIIIVWMCIVQGIYIGFLFCSFMIPIGVLVSLYGWFKSIVEPFQR